MSVELDKIFIEDYNKPESAAYITLSRDITVLVSILHFSNRFLMSFNVDIIRFFLVQLEQQYRNLDGFLGVSVTKFRYICFFIKSKCYVSRLNVCFNTVLLVSFSLKGRKCYYRFYCQDQIWISR